MIAASWPAFTIDEQLTAEGRDDYREIRARMMTMYCGVTGVLHSR